MQRFRRILSIASQNGHHLSLGQVPMTIVAISKVPFRLCTYCSQPCGCDWLRLLFGFDSFIRFDHHWSVHQNVVELHRYCKDPPYMLTLLICTQTADPIGANRPVRAAVGRRPASPACGDRRQSTPNGTTAVRPRIACPHPSRRWSSLRADISAHANWLHSRSRSIPTRKCEALHTFAMASLHLRHTARPLLAYSTPKSRRLYTLIWASSLMFLTRFDFFATNSYSLVPFS